MRERLLAADAATSVATAAMIAAVAPVTTHGAPAAACQPAYVAGAIYAAGLVQEQELDRQLVDTT
ncbi:hypothetical protein GA0074692_0946 [Micromonospora pallida]|uniref:Uncharacterized protein n=1 Tax=Micromonospora pallida TaxID=145854 RepID=A0A1C6RTY0_9ACTN|nr:hypothetical protein [Micromonospora pallida]SCL20680.1 hypothetical protein GA0074692_0946 [Micromonospora pallida]